MPPVRKTARKIPASTRSTRNALVKETELLAELRMQEAHIKLRREEQTARVLAMLETKTTVVSLSGGSTVRLTKVTPTSTFLDEDRLKKALGAQMFLKITKRVLDKGKLEIAISDGDIDPVIVAKCSEVSEGVTYLKFTNS